MSQQVQLLRWLATTQQAQPLLLLLLTAIHKPQPRQAPLLLLLLLSTVTHPQQ
jgi:hypothetical protein